MILGTAGHIDHGKTSLVRALTGVDTDRLPEEKRRGITIELGFAPLVIEGVGTLGVVDVPGHEAFVRTMVAGATGVDLALLVVAADEGVMPQTREHLAILELLGVTHGIIALTKSDLVDAEWVALVEEDVRAASQRALPNAPIIATSVQSGEGIQALRDAIASLAKSIARRDDSDLFRLPVDRAFTIKGTGTVVTGTVWSGRLDRDATVRILPGDRTARVRGIQGHSTQLDAALPGARAAVALTGIEVADVARGETLVTDRTWRTTTLARADITLIADDIELRPRTWFRFHVGTTEVGARVVARAADIDPSRPFAARIALDAPVLLRAGDRFVLRSSAPLNTIAGGVITDPYAPKRARPWPASLTPLQRFERLVADAGNQGLDVSSLPVRLGRSPAACSELVGAARESVAEVAGHFVTRTIVDSLRDSLVTCVDAFHASHPLELGIPIQLLRTELNAGAELVELATREAIAVGAVVQSSGGVMRVGWAPKLESSQAALADSVIERLGAAGAEPPTVEELAVEMGSDVLPIMRFLERNGLVVQVESNRYYTDTELKSLVSRLRAAMASGAEFGPPEIRDALGLSRKFLIPFLEYCDRVGHTNRRVNGRVWKGA
ncbi:MAG TPA: selenocysteine-specific translation elongation factor [Gemmatimonadaceae bacterium]